MVFKLIDVQNCKILYDEKFTQFPFILPSWYYCLVNSKWDGLDLYLGWRCSEKIGEQAARIF